jgi:outer membrane beta-barrel protein
MKRRFFTGLVAALGVAGAVTAGSSAEAQEIQLTGPLKGQPPVRHERLYKEGRFELAPTASFTLLDEYRHTILFGARLQYNIKEWIGIGVWGAFGAISTTTGLTDQIDSTALRNNFTASNVNHGAALGNGNYANAPFADQVAKLSYVAAPQITLTPFRGKLAIFQKIFVDTDLYLSGGVAFVGIKERGDCTFGGANSCTSPASFALASQTKIAPTIGLGLSFYLNNLVSLGLEYRALPFSWNQGGFDTRGAGTDNKFPDGAINSQDDTFKWNQMITVLVGFALPEAKISE